MKSTPYIGAALVSKPLVGHTRSAGFSAEGFDKLLSNLKTASDSQTAFEPDVRGVHFSTHALSRMEKRNIQLSPSQCGRFESGVRSLESKGAKNALVVVDDARFIVSVDNKTVITAMSSMDRDVYTNIDGVAFV